MVSITISHYKAIVKIGQGGMGEVCRAEDTNLSHEMANRLVSVIPDHRHQDDGTYTSYWYISASPWRRGRDSNPRYSYPYTRFPSVLLKPLGHLSGTPDYINRRRWDSNPRAQLITRQPDFESGPLRPLRYSSILKRLQRAGREMSSQEGRGKFGGSTWESRWYSMIFRGTSRESL